MSQSPEDTIKALSSTVPEADGMWYDNTTISPPSLPKADTMWYENTTLSSKGSADMDLSGSDNDGDSDGDEDKVSESGMLLYM